MMQMLVLSEKVPRGMEEVAFDKILKYAMAFESEFDKIHVITSHDYSTKADIKKMSFHRANWHETTNNFLGIFTHILYLADVFCTGVQLLRRDKGITVVTNSWGHYTLGLLVIGLARALHRKSIVRVAGSLDVGTITFERRYGRTLPIKKILSKLEKISLKYSNLVISVSESIFERCPGIRKKTFIIPDLFLAIDEFAKDMHCLEKGSSKTGEIKILYIGRLEPEKGVDILLESVRSLQIHCTIVGDGSLRVELKKQAERLGIKDLITFTGFLPQKDVYNLICISDILVLPSHTEFTPNVVVEAMGIGTVVIASYVGGIKYLIKDGETGFTFRRGSATELTTVLKRVINDPPLRYKVSAMAKRQVYVEFGSDKIKRKSAEAIRRLQVDFHD